MIKKSRGLSEILSEYNTLPEYAGMELEDVNQKSRFGDYPIHISCVQGNIDELQTLLDNGADVNASGEHGYTPLHSAVEQGQLVVVRHLIAAGADVSITNNDGDTPLQLAFLLSEEYPDGVYVKIVDTLKSG